MKKIGIISGAGPYAGVVLHQKIIKRYQRQGFYHDKDFPLISHISYPFSALSEEGVVDGSLATTELKKALSLLDCDKVMLACNSLIPYVPYVADKSPMVDTRELINSHLQKNSIRSLFILASRSSVASGLYDNLEVEKIYPDSEQQKEVTNIIKEVMQGNLCDKRLSRLIKNIQYPILLGCTELCVYKAMSRTINTLDLLADTSFDA